MPMESVADTPLGVVTLRMLSRMENFSSIRSVR